MLTWIIAGQTPQVLASWCAVLCGYPIGKFAQQGRHRFSACAPSLLPEQKIKRVQLVKLERKARSGGLPPALMSAPNFSEKRRIDVARLEWLLNCYVTWVYCRRASSKVTLGAPLET
jgi:hypothetical protein